MATRLDYRNDLKDKILGLEDEGYGDFEYSDTEYDTYLELAVARLYPAVFSRDSLDDQTPTAYGSSGTKGYVTVPLAESVYLVEDATELEPLQGWSIRAGRIIGIDTQLVSAVNIHFHDAYTLPSDDVTDAGIPARFTPLVVLGALVEALESRHDTGVRGDPQPHGYHSETQLIDRLTNRYTLLKDDMAMSLPGVIL